MANPDPRIVTNPDSRIAAPRWLLWAAAAALVVAALLVVIDSQQHIDFAPLLDRPAPGFALPLLGDADRRQGLRRGPQDSRGRVLLLHFWAPSCQPCVEELEQWQAIERDGRRHGYDVLLVGGDDTEALLPLLRAKAPGVPAVVDATGSGFSAFGINGIPATVVIDGKGIVRQFLQGRRTPAAYAAAAKRYVGEVRR